MTSVYEALERPMVEVLARMEGRGISIDRTILSRLSGEFAQDMRIAQAMRTSFELEVRIPVIMDGHPTKKGQDPECKHRF